MSSFKDVVGHKNIIKYISSAVQADAVSHAYILNGERGSGKLVEGVSTLYPCLFDEGGSVFATERYDCCLE